MTPEQALPIIQNLHDNCLGDQDTIDALKTAIIGIKRQIPLKPYASPLANTENKEMYSYVCPVCVKFDFGAVVVNKWDNNCPSCGQKLDWGEMI